MSQINKDLIGNAKRIYMIGIGGVGMSALARVLLHRGLIVSGSDSKESPRIHQLIQEGIPVVVKPKQVCFADTDLVIYSSAIHTDHLELESARASGARVYHRAEILASLLNEAKTSVAITGTHGKTTTASMVSYVLSHIGKKPTCLVGGEVLNFKSNALLGEHDLWISEVDESDQTHEYYAPHYAIVTNLEEDHMDHYEDWKQLEASFRLFFSNMSYPGVLIYNADDTKLSKLVKESGKPAVSFAVRTEADFVAENIHQEDFGMAFDLLETGFYAGSIKLAVPGIHNVENALAAIALLVQLGIDLDDMMGALQDFQGAKRRLEVIGEFPNVTIIDDYAHHPTEVRASIQAMHAMKKPTTVVFQPHRYSRTQHFAEDFGHAFDAADEIILTDIYGAGEKNAENVTVQCLYEQIKASGHANVCVLKKDEIISYLLSHSQLQGLVAFLGAGDIGETAYEFAGRLKGLPAA